MALGESLRRLGASGLVVARQRLELAALDVEEEVARAGTLVAWMLAFCALATLTLAAAAAWIVIVFWDTARATAIGAVTLFFGLAAAFVGARLRRILHGKPPFLAATLDELKRDGDALNPKT